MALCCVNLKQSSTHAPSWKEQQMACGTSDCDGTYYKQHHCQEISFMNQASAQNINFGLQSWRTESHLITNVIIELPAYWMLSYVWIQSSRGLWLQLLLWRCLTRCAIRVKLCVISTVKVVLLKWWIRINSTSTMVQSRAVNYNKNNSMNWYVSEGTGIRKYWGTP